MKGSISSRLSFSVSLYPHETPSERMDSWNSNLWGEGKQSSVADLVHKPPLGLFPFTGYVWEGKKVHGTKIQLPHFLLSL
jgi:hypothetical protein